MEARHSFGCFSNFSSRLRLSRSEFSLRRVSSIEGRSLDSPDHEEYRLLHGTTLQVSDSLELIGSSKNAPKPQKFEKQAELKSGFSLFQTLFPSQNGGKKGGCKSDDTFREKNHITVRPKGCQSEGCTPSTARWDETASSTPDLRPKYTSNPHRRAQKKPEKELNILSWLDLDDPIPLRHTLSGPSDLLERGKTLPAISSPPASVRTEGKTVTIKRKVPLLPSLQAASHGDGGRAVRHFPTL